LKCIGCGTCVISCPTYALSVSCDTFQCEVDRELCNNCLGCIDYCPTDAIEET
jgi:ferredoxin